MRQVTVQLIQDNATQKFRVEVCWSASSDDPIENAVADLLKPALDKVIRSVLPDQLGYGEGGSPEEARTRAFIERDIGAAGRKEEKP